MYLLIYNDYGSCYYEGDRPEIETRLSDKPYGKIRCRRVRGDVTYVDTCINLDTFEKVSPDHKLTLDD